MAKRRKIWNARRAGIAESAIKTASTVDTLADTVVPSMTDSVQIDCGRHHVEQDVQRMLLSHPQLQFSSLVVHRTPEGVCLEGVLETDEECPDVCRLACSVSGVNEVINRLTVKQHSAPTKG